MKFSPTVSGEAGILLTLLSESSFLVSLVCLDKYLKLLLRPTELLQKRDLDILDAYNMMEDVIKVFFFFCFFLQSIIKFISLKGFKA